MKASAVAQPSELAELMAEAWSCPECGHPVAEHGGCLGRAPDGSPAGCDPPHEPKGWCSHFEPGVGSCRCHHICKLILVGKA